MYLAIERMQTSVLSLHRSGSGQTTLLPLHRSGSGQKKQQMKRLTPEQAQLIAFLSFLFLLVLYIVYNVRTLMSAAKARQMEQAALLSQQTVPAALEPLSALPSANLSRFKAERGFEAEKITHVLDAKLVSWKVCRGRGQLLGCTW